LVLRGAACTINDLFDRDIDRKVERTRLRPLASGLLTPFQGIQFLGLQLLLLLGILLQLNNYSRVLGALSLLLNFSYPLMTRFTHWPQAFLGFTINWGALLGWAAVKESLEPADKEDDLKVGQLGWQIGTEDFSSRFECSRKFVSNKCFGAIISSGVLLGRTMEVDSRDVATKYKVSFRI
ncbi:hypothetical protein HID58_056655, partial [Brassica napus]